MRPLGRMISRLFLPGLRRTAYFRDAKRNHQSREDRFHAEFERLTSDAASPA